jgi:integrase/recombinase XerD
MAQARTLHENEIEQVLEFLKTKKYGYRDRAMLMVSHLSGMRVGEIASLTVGHVMDANGNIKGEIRLTADETKGKHPRTVFINSRLKEEFKKYFENVRSDDPQRALFPTQKNPRKGFTANTLTQHFLLNIYRASGLDGCSSHTGRRTYATSIASKGVGLRVLMRLMGHRNVSTTAVYIDANDNMLRSAVELV